MRRKKKLTIDLRGLELGDTAGLFRRVSAVLAPPPELTVSQWADRYRKLTSVASAEPGQWNTDRAPYQREIMDAVNDPRVTEIVAMTSAQIGKPLAIDTPIPTPDGWKTMGEMRPGDVVFGIHGNKILVTGVSPVKNGHPCYLMRFSDGSEIVSDAEHIWYVHSDLLLENGEYAGTITTEQIAKTYKYGAKANRNRYAIPVAAPLDLPEKDLPIKPYTLGVWLGDGHSASARIFCHHTDAEHFAREISKDGYRTKIEDDPAKCSTVRIDPKERNICPRGHNKDVVGWNGLGCAECGRIMSLNNGRKKRGKEPEKMPEIIKTMPNLLASCGLLHNKHIPSEYLRASIQQRMALLQGLMDTDGHVTKAGRCEFVTTSEKIADGFAELLSTLGIKYTMAKKQPTTKYKGDVVFGKPAFRFSFLAYSDIEIFRLRRKSIRLHGDIGGRPGETKRRRIVDVVPVESVPVRCIMVDSPNHLFLAGKTMIPTHNTELLLNIIGYYIDYDPAPILALQPTIEMGEAFSKDRIAPMLEASPALRGKVKDPRARDSGNTLRYKAFPGGHLTIAGANSPASLASRPVRVVLCDEVDRYPASAGTEGDPVNLAKKRTTSFWNRKAVLTSTPTIRGMSRIEAAYEASSRGRWHVPCPDCGHMQFYRWGQLDFDTGMYACEACGTLNRETAWKAGAGQWVHEDPDNPVRGFHLNEMASPWRRWSEMIADFREAKRKASAGNPELLKTWVNTALGETWEEDGDSIEIDDLEKRREYYNAELPEGVLVLSAGVDVQDDRLEVEVVGWGAEKESWGIDYKVIYGDPAQDSLWLQLDGHLQRVYRFYDGRALSIGCTCIDSGGHYTDEVYKFCKPREHRRVFAVKGKGGAGVPVVGKASRANRRKVALFPVGDDMGKELVFSRLRVPHEGPGYCHFPRDAGRGYDAAYFKGLVSEKRVLKYVKGRPKIEWVKTTSGARNEPLDCRKYATAALEILNPPLAAIAKRTGGGDIHAQQPKQAPSSAARSTRKRRVLGGGVRL
jgi:phage terminase large subunit GpA-like protein